MGQELLQQGGDCPKHFLTDERFPAISLRRTSKRNSSGRHGGEWAQLSIYTHTESSTSLLLLGVLNGCACGCRSCPSRVFGEACAAAWHRLISNTARRVGTCRARCQLFVRSKRWKQQQSIRELSPDLLFGRFSWCAEKGGRTDSPIQQNWIRFFFIYACSSERERVGK